MAVDLPDNARAIFLAGPTASGKSAAALEIAGRLVAERGLAAEIVNADSMQIYRDLDIISARPSAADEAKVPHHLYGYLGAERAYSSADWVADCVDVCADIWARQAIPLIVGGTGLYFKSLLSGLAEIPDIEDDIRQEVRTLDAEQGSESLYARLEAEDPVMAQRLHPNDRQRVARALEVILSTGQSLATFQAQDHAGPLRALVDRGALQTAVVTLDRAQLYSRCDQRFDLMLEHGGLDEIRTLMARGLPDSLPAMRALGVPPLISYLRGTMTLDQAREDAQRETRRFAKRQLTWFRNQFPGWDRLALHERDEKVAQIDKIISQI